MKSKPYQKAVQKKEGEHFSRNMKKAPATEDLFFHKSTMIRVHSLFVWPKTKSRPVQSFYPLTETKGITQPWKLLGKKPLWLQFRWILLGSWLHPYGSFFWTSLEGDFLLLSQRIFLRRFAHLHYFHYRPAQSKNIQQPGATREGEQTLIQQLPSACPVQGILYPKLLLFHKWETHIDKRFWLLFRDLKTKVRLFKANHSIFFL